MMKLQEKMILLLRAWFLESGNSVTTGMSRRAAVKLVAIASGVATLLMSLPRTAWSLFSPQSLKKKSAPGVPLPQWGMAIDLDKCTGCGACVVACAQENNVQVARYGPEYQGTQIYWMALLNKPNIFPIPCMHCADPPCVKVCPVGATVINEEGLVEQIYARCIGCRYCMEACPYSRRYFNWVEPEWPESMKSYINPSVSTRPKGVVEKCSFCAQRIRNLREEHEVSKQPIKDDELQRLPACAETCPANAITFGNLNDPNSLVSQLSREPRAFRLLEELGTKPKVVYLTKEKGGTA